jgi:hypothetical protein
MSLPFLCLVPATDRHALSAGDLAIVLLAAISATSGPENNVDYLQSLGEISAPNTGKNPALAFHFDRKGDQALVRPEA